jgi:hypothetical protein
MQKYVFVERQFSKLREVSLGREEIDLSKAILVGLLYLVAQIEAYTYSFIVYYYYYHKLFLSSTIPIITTFTDFRYGKKRYTISLYLTISATSDRP